MADPGGGDAARGGATGRLGVTGRLAGQGVRRVRSIFQTCAGPSPLAPVGLKNRRPSKWSLMERNRR